MSLSAHGIQFLFTPLNRHSLSTLHTPHLFAGTWDKKTNEAQSFAPVSAFPVFNLASMSLHVGSAFDSRSRAHLWYNMRKVQKNNEERMITLQCTHRYLLIYHSITSFLLYQQIFKEMIFFLTRKTVFYSMTICIAFSLLSYVASVRGLLFLSSLMSPCHYCQRCLETSHGRPSVFCPPFQFPGTVSSP